MSPDQKAVANVLAGLEDGPLPFPHLKVADLSPEMQERVGRHINAVLAERDRLGKDWPDDVLYLAALGDFGIDCSHPRRVAYGWYPPGAWDCAICGCAFVPIEAARR